MPYCSGRFHRIDSHTVRSTSSHLRFSRQTSAAARAVAALAVGAALAGGLAAPAAADHDALAGHWPLDELTEGGTKTPDRSGHGLDMTADGALGVIAGQLGGALDFPVATVVLKVPGSPVLEPAAGVTVSAWVKRSGPPGGFRYLIAKGAMKNASSCYAASYAIYAPGTGLRFYVWRATAGYVLSPSTPATVFDGNWHHVAGTYDGATVRAYLDGAQVGNGTQAPGTIRYGLPDNDLRIGSYGGDAGCGLPYNGGIDDVRIYNRALTPEEVAAIRAAPSTPALAYDPLVGRVGQPVAHTPRELRPTGAASFTVSPALPPGLALDTATGAVSGTPSAPWPETVHTVTMTDLAGQTSAELRVRIDAPPAPASTAAPAAPVSTAAPASPKFSALVVLPSARRCVSRRNFRIRLRQPAGVVIVEAVVSVNGKRVKVVRGKRLTAPVDLRGLPKGRFTVQITIRTKAGQSITGTRRYRTCAPRRRRG